MSPQPLTRFPRVPLVSQVADAERASAVDFVNRVNWLFETWDVDAMVEAFTPEGVAFHFHGVIRGRNEMRRFFEQDYPYLIPGVSRHATNHIVDADGDGVMVRYHNLLVRYAAPALASDLSAGKVLDSEDELPAIWIYSPMLDRLVRTEDGWRIQQRYVGGSMTNRRVEPEMKAADALRPFMPELAAWL